MGRLLRGFLPALVLALAGCIVVVREVPVRRIDPVAAAPAVRDSSGIYRGPARAHLRDGGTVLFRDSVRITQTELVGVGTAFAFMSEDAQPRGTVPLDSVVALETFVQTNYPGTSLFLSAALTGLGVSAAVLGAKALFGSCPTIYTDSGNGPVLQAEGFSYAIAPRFEHPDLDPINIVPDANGVLRFELRNEALETHYINRLTLLAVRHPVGALALPDQQQRTVLVDGLRAVQAIDRAGRDISSIVAEADDALYATPSALIDAATERDFDDWIDVTIGDAVRGDSIALVLRMRNSLLNTVLLYDVMLSSGDATNWLTSGMDHATTALRLGLWYRAAMGMRIEGGATETGTVVARLGDVGPIAFRDVAVVLPRSALDEQGRVRLRFAADNWRIDQVRVGRYAGLAEVVALTPRQVLARTSEAASSPVHEASSAHAVAVADSTYLQTVPGQRLWFEFEAPAAVEGEALSYLIGWQGWYREWMRGDWLARSVSAPPFEPGAKSLVAAMRKWRHNQEAFERLFYATKVPVR